MTQFSAVASAALDDERLTGPDILVLAALGYHTDKAGWCFPDQDTLAKKARLVRQTVNASIRRLIKFGYVERSIPENGDLSKIKYRRILDTARAPEAELPLPAALVVVNDKGVVAQSDKPLSSGATRLVGVEDKPCRVGRHKQEPSNKSNEQDAARDGLFEEIWGVWARKLKAEGNAGRGDGKAKTFEIFKRKAAATDPAVIRSIALEHVRRSKGYLEGLSVWLNKERYDRGDNVVAIQPAELTQEEKLYALETMGRWDASWGPRPVKQEMLL